MPSCNKHTQFKEMLVDFNYASQIMWHAIMSIQTDINENTLSDSGSITATKCEWLNIRAL